MGCEGRHGTVDFACFAARVSGAMDDQDHASAVRAASGVRFYREPVPLPAATPLPARTTVVKVDRTTGGFERTVQHGPFYTGDDVFVFLILALSLSAILLVGLIRLLTLPERPRRAQTADPPSGS